MFVGALAGALLVLRANGALALVLALALLAIVTAPAALVSRKSTSWSRPG